MYALVLILGALPQSTLVAGCPCDCPCASGLPCVCGPVCNCLGCVGKDCKVSPSSSGWSGTVCDSRTCRKYEWVPDADSDHWLGLKVSGRQVGAYCYQKQQYYHLSGEKWVPVDLPVPLPKPAAPSPTFFRSSGCSSCGG